MKFWLFKFFIVSFLCISEVMAEEFLEWQDLTKQQFIGQNVIVKGFLYKNDKDEIILAKEPNLKSCCIGNSSKIKEQILIQNNLDFEQNKIIIVKGSLNKGPSNRYTLYNASVVDLGHEFPWTSAGTGLLIIFGVNFCFRKILRPIKQNPLIP